MNTIFHTFRKTRSAVRSGNELWDLTDGELLSAGYMSSSMFNRLQNLVSIAIASPFIFIGGQVLNSIFSQEKDKLTYDGCIWAWVSAFWSAATPIMIAALAPVAVTAISLSLAHARPRFNHTVLKAFRYKSGAFTLTIKSCFLAAYGASLLICGLGLLAYNFIEKSGGFFWPGAGEPSIFERYLPELIIAAALSLSLLLLAAPIYFYSRFLVRFSRWVHFNKMRTDAKSSAERQIHPLMIALAVIVVATIFFVLSATLPVFGSLLILALGCSSLGIPGI